MKVPEFSGKTLHESLFDPKAFRLQLKRNALLQAKQDFSGATPNFFVGRWGYPNINVGLLSTQEYKRNDDPSFWVKNNTQIKDVLSLRSELVNAGATAHVKLPSSKMAQRIKDVAAEAAMSVRPVDTEIGLDKKPFFRLSTNDDLLPHGPSALLKKASITSNSKIPSFIDKIVSDSDLKATSSLGRLWKKGYSEHQLSKLLTGGTLGQQLERRLVPTRWGITAVDDSVGKQIHRQILDFPSDEFKVYVGGHLGNYFIVAFFPQSWSFELFENYVGTPNADSQPPLTTSYTDFENTAGRKSYAEKTAGGYYASRLAVLEHLSQKHRQAGVLALRFITDEYWAPLGVWVVREAVRNALSAKPLSFASWELMKKYLELLAKRKFGVSIEPVLSASRLLAERRSQTSLSSFFS